MAEERGDWWHLRARLEELYAITDERADGHYLVVLGRKRQTVDRVAENVLRARPASRRARSKCSSCSRRACPTRRSPSG